MGAESNERSQQVVCYRAWGEIGALSVEEQEKGCRAEAFLTVLLPYLLVWQVLLVCLQRMPPGVGG